MLATIKSGEAAGRRNLRVQLVLERLTGEAQDDRFVSADMRRGAELEPQAVAAYEVLTGQLVQPVGFCAHDTLLAGCSPDGLVGDVGGVLEVKCPKAATHLESLRTQTIPGDYLKQIVHLLWITGAPWCDFVSYDPRFPDGLRLLITRVERHAIDLSAYEGLVRLFLREVEQELAEVVRMTTVGAAA